MKFRQESHYGDSTTTTTVTSCFIGYTYPNHKPTVINTMSLT